MVDASYSRSSQLRDGLDQRQDVLFDKNDPLFRWINCGKPKGEKQTTETLMQRLKTQSEGFVHYNNPDLHTKTNKWRRWDW